MLRNCCLPLNMCAVNCPKLVSKKRGVKTLPLHVCIVARRNVYPAGLCSICLKGNPSFLPQCLDCYQAALSRPSVSYTDGSVLLISAHLFEKKPTSLSRGADLKTYLRELSHLVV